MKKQQGIPKDFDFESFSKEAVDRLRQGEELNGKDGILTPLIKQILESALNAELSDTTETNVVLECWHKKMNEKQYLDFILL